MLFSTVDVLASYFPVAAKRARPHALYPHAQGMPGAESEISESELDAEEIDRPDVLKESKKEAVAKVRAAMEVQISQLENALAAALENNGQLSKQIEMEHRHSIQLEEKCIELEIQYEQSTSHNLRTIAERDNYKLRVES